MPPLQPPRIELYQGNPTLRALMKASLDEAGFAVSAHSDGLSLDAESAELPKLGDLLVVDLDSDLGDLRALVEHYERAERPVLTCGVSASRERHRGELWLGRPFSPEYFVARCMVILGLDKLPRLAQGAQSTATKTPDNDDILGETRQISAAEVERLKTQVGLEDGLAALKASHNAQLQEDESTALNQAPQTGAAGDEALSARAQPRIVGEPKRRRLDAKELANKPPRDSLLNPLSPLFERSSMMTVPELRAIQLSDESDAAGSPIIDPEPAQGRATRPDNPTLGSPATSSHNSSINLAPGVEERVTGVAALLGEAWVAIGRLARAADRSAQIRRILRAAVAEGVGAAEDEVRRIPSAPGFGGDLAAMGVNDLLKTIAERQLRGRLELSIGAEDFVLFLDADRLDEVEDLSADHDLLLLDILRELDSLTEQDYTRLKRSLDDPLAPPVLSQLRGGGRSAQSSAHPGVTAQDVRRARRLRARRIFNLIRAAEQQHAPAGNFAFISVRCGGGHAWPPEALRLDIQDLLEHNRREDSMEAPAEFISNPGSENA